MVRAVPTPVTPDSKRLALTAPPTPTSLSHALVPYQRPSSASHGASRRVSTPSTGASTRFKMPASPVSPSPLRSYKRPRAIARASSVAYSDYVNRPVSPSASTRDFNGLGTGVKTERAHSCAASESLASESESLFGGGGRPVNGKRPREYRPRSTDGDEPGRSAGAAPTLLFPETPASLVRALDQVHEVLSPLRLRSGEQEVICLSVDGAVEPKEEPWQIILDCLFRSSREELVRGVQAVLRKLEINLNDGHINDFLSYLRIKTSAAMSADAADYLATSGTNAKVANKASRAMRQRAWYCSVKGGLLADAVMLKSAIGPEEARSIMRAAHSVWSGALEDAIHEMLADKLERVGLREVQSIVDKVHALGSALIDEVW